jgi:hypothetical protein
MKKGAVVFLAIFLVFSFTALADKPSQDDVRMLRHLGENPNSVLVMTRNIYVGGNVDRVIEEQDPNQVPLRVLETFAEVQSTDFNVRAQALADEIEQAQPHLIGLQEISLIRYQSPGDFFVDPTPNATYVVWDYLDILMDALEDRELDYEVAGIIQNADVELPMIVSFIPPFAFDDVRLTDFDVVLARKDVVFGNVVEKNYAAMLYFPPIIIPRGYVALDATVGHKTYRFVNTHLEPFIPAIQALQAAELMADLASETLPIILVGDLNTEAPTGDTYQTLLFNGYVDAWTENQVRPKIPGYTSGHDSDLRNVTVDLDERIDLIMVNSHWTANGRPNIGPVFAYVVGDELADRLVFPPDGSLIWPSDHAGVVALLHIPIPGKDK